MKTQSRILVVDDNTDICVNIETLLSINGYLVDTVINGEQAISFCRKNQYNIILVDICLPDIQGPELVDKIAKISLSTDFIYITGHALLNSAIEAVKRERVVSYETKPLDLEHLLFIIQQVIQRQHVEKSLVEERLLLTQRVAERTIALNKTNLDLARAVRLKDEFLASMSHELRTPLASVLGNTELLLEGIYGSLNKKQIKSLQTIEGSGQHLLSLINDVLDLSRIGAGKMELEREQVQIIELCHKSLHFIRQRSVQKKNLQVTLTLDHTKNISLNADPQRLKQILVNLLNNAVKFTPNGGSIDLEVKTNEADQVIHFIVSDTGIGIASEDMERLFQPFIQADSRLARKYEGIGLGLTLAQHLTELHGGSLSLDSTLDKGSRFTVSLPCYEIPVVKKQKPEEIMFVSLKTTDEPQQNEYDKLISGLPKETVQSNHAEFPIVLLAEDNEESLSFFSSYLEAKNYQVITARDGSEAIIRIQETPPDIILMDIQMPVVNGLEAIERIRAFKEFQTTPIIALTALALPGDCERCLALGANKYLNKPVSPKNLLKIIENLLGDCIFLKSVGKFAQT
ncbi:response regulator [Candidatus Parabeggiatoa sp. HSG14]|uniref:response regulator n=1 Tax=Candidatus Parabeggiatoa sp. HSG14 TaxID=3055593 RepID=UPI0025A79D3E|nr:response regulator [Thiotrichales bacterium HSG14]